MQPSRLRILLLALAGLALFLVAACGDDDNATSSPMSAGTSTATAASSAIATSTAASADDVTIKLGFSAWPGWFPWQVAKEKGIFDQAGVKVDLTYFEGYLDSINAFAAGQLDANTQTLNDTIPSVAAGSDQRIVLVNDNSTGNDQIIADASITSVADLRGKTIGVEEGVVDHFLLLLGLKDAGMTEADVHLQNLETGAAAAAFAAGQMDAVAVFAPFTTQALTRTGSHALFTSKEYPGSIPDHLVVSGDLADKHPVAVQKLVNAWFMTLDWIHDNPDEAKQIMSKRAGVSVSDYESYDAGTTIFTLDQNLEAFTPGTTNKSLQYVAEQENTFLHDAGFIDKEPDLSKLLTDKFVKAYAASH
jgi:NitT/TauT family transport system substrate-binding protein